MLQQGSMVDTLSIQIRLQDRCVPGVIICSLSWYSINYFLNQLRIGGVAQIDDRLQLTGFSIHIDSRPLSFVPCWCLTNLRTAGIAGSRKPIHQHIVSGLLARYFTISTYKDPYI